MGKRILELLVERKIKPGEFIDVYRKNNSNIERTIEYFDRPNYKQLKFRGSGIINGWDPHVGSVSQLLHFLEKNRIGLTDISKDDYPDLLRQIYYPPLLLFSKGRNNMSTGCSIAVVGSRKCTAYGREIARDIGRNLSKLGITVVSGLATGIDSSAHIGALKEKGGSIGVLGCGIDIIYPPENKRLFDQMQENGTVITEFFPGTPPLRSNFPVRNRIISGLCRGVVIVEAGEKSGAVITCVIALRQDREVFAVPGSIFNMHSKGCHKLIKSGAKLIEGVDDILDELSQYFTEEQDSLKKEGQLFSGRQEKKKGGIDLSRGQYLVYKALGHEPKTLEEIAGITGVEVKEVLRKLSLLELKKLVLKDSPGRYLKV